MRESRQFRNPRSQLALSRRPLLSARRRPTTVRAVPLPGPSGGKEARQVSQAGGPVLGC
jgi:hypothetical protein